MELSEIWISIIIPIVIGPVFVYLKSLRDEIADKRYKSKREKYIEERDYLFTILDKFYWPVYINLLYIEQYSYKLPIKNKFRYESSSDASNYSEHYDKHHHTEKDDTLYYSLSLDPSDTQEDNNANQEDNSIPTNSIPTKIMNTSNSINITINEFDVDTEYNNMNRSPITIVSDSSSDNYEISIPVSSNKDILKRKVFSKIINKKIILDKSTLTLFESILKTKYTEIVSIIETNISKVCIHENLNIEIIKFIKYAKIRDIIHEGSPIQEYNIEYFGVENNVNLLINLFKQELDIKNKLYSELISNPV